MKNKKRLLALFGLMIMALVTLQVSGETKKLRDIGRYKFLPVDPGRPASEMMKSLAASYADDIRRGFEVAGAPELYAPFLEQLGQAAFTEKELAVGTKLIWMVFRSQGQIKSVHDLEWAGQGPLPVCAFSVQEGDRRYEIVVPKACGNIALERIEAAPAPAEEEVPAKPAVQEQPKSLHEITRAGIYQEIADLINETDLYCSFSVWEGEVPELRIIGAERQDEKEMYSDGDLVYLNKGNDGGIETGQIFWAQNIGLRLPEYGPVAFGKGRVRVLHVTADRSVAVVENACQDLRKGDFLVPFEAKEGMMGKDLGYDVPPVETDGPKGRLVFLESELRQIASLQRGLLDLGSDQGMQVGQQLILYRRVRSDLPAAIIGNGVIIDVRKETSTIKVLSCKDILRRGDQAMSRPL